LLQEFITLHYSAIILGNVSEVPPLIEQKGLDSHSWGIAVLIYTHNGVMI